MGVYIKGVEMPESCHACCFFGQADIWESDFDGYTKSFCKRTGSQTYDYVDKFLPNCPLVPVPPHGKLIEKHAVFELVWSFPDVDRQLPFEFMKALYEIPTTIPAEEGE